YKGISTYDYVKRSRQKEARKRDSEAKNSCSSKPHGSAQMVGALFLFTLCSRFSPSCKKPLLCFRAQKDHIIVNQRYQRVQGNDASQHLK
ncbi:hypothetical protein GOODEAATRI_033484, partial [Goodea atripinnis]